MVIKLKTANHIQEQYEMLLRCSEKRSIKEWNYWRINNPNVKIELGGAKLTNKHLIGACLKQADLLGAQFIQTDLSNANLKDSILFSSNLEQAKLYEASLENAILQKACLKGAKLHNTNLKNANFSQAQLEQASVLSSSLENAVFLGASVDGTTQFVNCKISKKTDFRNVGLDIVRIDSNTRGLLKYNARRMNWEEWYQKHKIYQHPSV